MKRRLLLSIVAPEGMDLSEAFDALDAIGIARPTLQAVSAFGARERGAERLIGFVDGEGGEGRADAQRPTSRTAMYTNVMRVFDGTQI